MRKYIILITRYNRNLTYKQHNLLNVKVCHSLKLMSGGRVVIIPIDNVEGFVTAPPSFDPRPINACVTIIVLASLPACIRRHFLAF